MNGGEKFLALLSQDLARSYGSGILEDDVLRKYATRSVTLKDFNGFSLTKSDTSIDIPKDVNLAIRKCSKFFKGNRLGLRYVLLAEFGLSHDVAEKIVNSSTSIEEALLKGYEKSLPPESRKSKLAKLIFEVQATYPTAKEDKTLKAFVKNNPISNNLAKYGLVRGENPDHPKPALNKSEELNNTISKTKEFEQKSYPPGSKGFPFMTSEEGGYGGIIFGNDVKKDLSVGELDYVRWIPDEKQTMELNMGSIEFNFKNGKEYYLTDVFEEDYYAAYNIFVGAQDSFFLYKPGEGVGFAGIFGYDYYKWGTVSEVVLHPYVSNLELGWAALLSDLLPATRNTAMEYVNKYASEDESLEVKNWYDNHDPNSGWKIINIPSTIYTEGPFLKIKAQDTIKYDGTNSNLTMISFKSSYSKPQEVPSFNSVVPILSKSIYEFYRINEFAKIFSVFQWAQQEGAAFIDFPETPNLVSTPTNLMFNRSKGEIIVPENFHEQYEVLFEYNSSDLSDSLGYKYELKEVIKILKIDPNFSITISGHTDNIGSNSFNSKLGYKRAKAVKKYLINQGVNSKVINLSTFGEQEPIDDNTTELGRSKNRRATIEVSYELN